jgi:hypothetical protein
MTDDELRKLVRGAIARHLGDAAGSGAVGGAVGSSGAGNSTPPWRSHASFAKFLNLPADAEAGPCMIEPTVACNHCGFCKSYGH